ncbi:hypothetical protein PR202_gb13159 [Eleusine coracana subsp. coracana]|uniref:Uncharacterized protein n=1 Tax=Eleusine coracana subsp. coracana TaxID=191504 RepID=A0AAV5ESE2_ELECO|nr:hypothetical protein PR202_gb13159 [Eleusine coracana subsp. coracana]
MPLLPSPTTQRCHLLPPAPTAQRRQLLPPSSPLSRRRWSPWIRLSLTPTLSPICARTAGQRGGIVPVGAVPMSSATGRSYAMPRSTPMDQVSGDLATHSGGASSPNSPPCLGWVPAAISPAEGSLLDAPTALRRSPHH